MWTDVVVLSEPLIDDNLCLLCRREPFGVEHLVAQGAVEALVVSVLPGGTIIKVHGPRITGQVTESKQQLFRGRSLVDHGVGKVSGILL